MNARNSAILALPLLLALVLSCEQNVPEPSPTPVPEGSYRYTAYDENGALAVRGWMTIEFEDSQRLNGEWHFVKVGDASRMGPQVGDGKLVGSAEDGRVWIELNPEYRDNNVSLTGSLGRSSLEGTWTWSTFIGVTSQGKFEATR